ncbi:MAG: gamma-glutamyltransferase [bacterium]
MMMSVTARRRMTVACGMVLILFSVRPSAAQEDREFAWRPLAMGDHGAVAAGHPLAAQAGLEVLKSGGNAVDAAVAMAGVLAVVRPHMNGLGGDTFMLIYSARDGQLYGLNGSGRAGSGADADALRVRGLQQMPVRGLAPVTVPGASAAWAEALRRFGSRSLSGLLEPGIRLAAGGFPVSPKLHRDLTTAQWLIEDSPELSAVFMPRDEIPPVGDMLVQTDLAASMRAVASSGGTALYTDGLADRLASHSRSEGGYITAGDLAGHTSDWVEPITTSYRGLEVAAMPPNTQGMALLEMLNIIEPFDLEKLRQDDGSYLHVLIEAKKLAFADRDEHASDPAGYQAPLDSLLSKEYALAQAARISMEVAAPEMDPGQPRDREDDTVVCIASDIQGNMVVLIQSLFNSFGSGVMVPGTGIILQNRGALFSLEAGHPNELRPGHRSYHTLCPSMVLQEGRPILGLATPGGDGQVQTLVQVLNQWHLFGLDIQRAVEAPRFRSYSGLQLRLEQGVGLDIINGLEERGHQLRLYPTGESADFGGAQGIVVLRRGPAPLYMAGADPRREAKALAW